MKKHSFLLLYFYSPLILATFLFVANPIKYSNFPRLLSMLMGVCAYTWFNWQFILSARPKFIDRIIGMDRIYRLHGIMAIVSLILIAGHQILNNNIFSENQMIRIGKVAFLIFIVISILSSVFMVSSVITKKQPIKLIKTIINWVMVFKYEHLKLIHNLTIVALIFMLVHVLMTSAVRTDFIVFAGYMSYFSLAFGFYVYHKLLKPWLRKGHRYEIMEVANESADIWRIDFKNDKRQISYQPGQFAFFRFAGEGINEEHPFTISSSPTEKNRLSIIVKELGDFTSQIGKIKPGDELTMEGPYGRFSYLNYSDEKQIVFIVGGIGITPALSMMQNMADTLEKRKVLLIWGVRHESDIIMKNKLEELKQKLPGLKIIPIVSDEDEYEGEKGFISGLMLARIFNVNNITPNEAGCYLCGPEIFMSIAKKALIALGVNQESVHDERFSM